MTRSSRALAVLGLFGLALSACINTPVECASCFDGYEVELTLQELPEGPVELYVDDALLGEWTPPDAVNVPPWRIRTQAQGEALTEALIELRTTDGFVLWEELVTFEVEAQWDECVEPVDPPDCYVSSAVLEVDGLLTPE